MKKPFGGSFSGFTLIELLVVVLIIGSNYFKKKK